MQLAKPPVRGGFAKGNSVCYQYKLCSHLFENERVYCLCRCVDMCASVCIHVRVEAGAQPWKSFTMVLRQSLTGLELTSKLQESSCLSLSGAGITPMHHPAWHFFFMCVLGIELRYSCLQALYPGCYHPRLQVISEANIWA